MVNEAFLTLYRSRNRLWASDSPDAFAFKVLRDVLTDHFRRKDRQPKTERLPDEVPSGGHPHRRWSPDDEQDVIIRVDLCRALDELPQRQADCMRLHTLLDHDAETIARYLGINASSVRSHLHLARKQLIDRLAVATEDTP